VRSGHADHGWLNSRFTFSFAGYYQPKFNNFHSLRVINEDRVTASQGFGSHPHSNYEIFSYVVSGALRHRDNMGNVEVLPRGSVQFTSAGTGIVHSEYNASDKEIVHFIQMWVTPSKTGACVCAVGCLLLLGPLVHRTGTDAVLLLLSC
jgi:redox-sensitive bicupin YhaK (pirin superfamily)